jgi:hypothetical protein
LNERKPDARESEGVNFDADSYFMTNFGYLTRNRVFDKVFNPKIEVLSRFGLCQPSKCTALHDSGALADRGGR